MSKFWINYYIYYQNDFTILLKNGISPLIKLLSKLQLLEEYFFLRYWKGGPHLRLRLRASESSINKLTELTESYLEKYLQKYPSETSINPKIYENASRIFSSLENERCIDLNLVENNKLIRAEYEPEKHKYGGEIGVKIAERIFIESSKIIMDIIDKPTFTTKSRYTSGISMMFIAVKAFELGLSEMVEFFNHYYTYWKKILSKDYCEFEIEKIADAQKNVLSSIFEKVNNGDIYKIKAFLQWYNILANERLNLLKSLPEIKEQISYDMAKETTIKYLLSQFIHTHNNRLGLFATEEAILGYLAMFTISNYLCSQKDIRNG